MMFKLILVFSLFTTTVSFAQKHEFRIGYRFGIDVGGRTNTNSVLSSNFDQGAILQFKYRVWERAKLYVMLGYDQSFSNYSIYTDLFGNSTRYDRFNRLTISRNGLHVGINKKFELNKFSIDLGVNAATRIRSYKNLTATAQGGFNEPPTFYRQFTFEMRPFFRDLGLEYNASVAYAFSDNFCVDMGITHSRDHFMEYESYAKVIEANGVATTSQLKTYFEVNHFLYLTIGLVYRL